MIKNLLSFSENEQIENHVIYTIEASKKEQATIIDFPKAASVQLFHYHRNWNFYFTCKQLSKLLPDDKAVIVAHDWLELGMCSHLGLQNPVVQFLHGDYPYYYQLATAHQGVIDRYIAVSRNIQLKLAEELPERKNDIDYLRFPVPDAAKRLEHMSQCNIVFIGRLTAGKGYHLLPAIASELKKLDINASWHIAGQDEDGLQEKLKWETGIDVHHYGQLDEAGIQSLLGKMDYFVLPSLFEGMPVTLVEAMKVGVIPVVNDIDGGVQELITDGESGYRITGNTPEAYAERIATLETNKSLSDLLSKNCVAKANGMFSPEENTRLIENAFLEAATTSKKKLPSRVYGSRLDKEWLPNEMVEWVRRTLNA